MLVEHFKGGRYTVIDDNATISTNGPDNGKRCVVYCSHTYGKTYVREYGEFYGVVPDGRGGYVQRFKKFDPWYKRLIQWATSIFFKG